MGMERVCRQDYRTLAGGSRLEGGMLGFEARAATIEAGTAVGESSVVLLDAPSLSLAGVSIGVDRGMRAWPSARARPFC